MKLRVKFQRIVTKGTRVGDRGKFERGNAREGNEKKKKKKERGFNSDRAFVIVIVKVCLYNPPINDNVQGAK